MERIGLKPTCKKPSNFFKESKPGWEVLFKRGGTTQHQFGLWMT